MPEYGAIHRRQLGGTLGVFRTEPPIDIIQDLDRCSARLGRLSREIEHRSTHLHIRSSQGAMNHPPAETLGRRSSMVVNDSEHSGLSIRNIATGLFILTRDKLARSSSNAEEFIQPRSTVPKVAA